MLSTDSRATLLLFIAALGCGETTRDDSLDEAAGPVTFVAVGEAGTIVTSADGLDWRQRSPVVPTRLNSVAASDTVFVAVGEGGVILSSSDGVAWTKSVSPTPATLSHVVFNGEKFVAVGGDWSAGGVVLVSHDGSSWNTLSAPSGYTFEAVAPYREPSAGADGLVVAAHLLSDLQTPALFGTALSPGSSASGSWSQSEGPDFVDGVWASSISDDVVVVGADGVSVSSDASSWTQPELDAVRVLHGIAFGGWQVGAGLSSGFVAVGEQGTIYEAPYAEGPWLKVAGDMEQSALRAVALGTWYQPEPRALFVAVGDGGRVLTKLVGALDFAGMSRSWEPAAGEVATDLLDVAARLR
jgi:hypothetical protein